MGAPTGLEYHDDQFVNRAHEVTYSNNHDLNTPPDEVLAETVDFSDDTFYGYPGILSFTEADLAFINGNHNYDENNDFNYMSPTDITNYV